jgi:phosphoribosylglycinamide formyltransferase-1
MRIAVLASGSGSNFEALVQACLGKEVQNAEIVLLVTDKQKAFVRQRAKKYNIPQVFLNPTDYQSRQAFDEEIIKVLQEHEIEFVLLAGYMRILSPFFVSKFKNKILNIHPALLPAFKGSNAIEQAYNYGVKVVGVTVHFVDAKVDHGPILLQQSLAVKPGESLEQLRERIHKLEHCLYPRALDYCINKKVEIKNRLVEIKDK